MGAAEQIVDDSRYGERPKRVGSVSAGETFGELTTVRVVATSHLGHMWECACACGRKALRTAAVLNRSRRMGQSPCCSECLSELRRGMSIERGSVCREAWAALWASRRTLYSRRAIDRIVGDIQEALVNDIAPVRPEMTVAPLAARADQPRQRRVPGTRITYLYPIVDTTGERMWQCHECRDYFDAGLGCINCIEFLCRACVRKDVHDCESRSNLDREMTLEDIRASIGRVTGDGPVSRAMIGCLEERALGKLRRVLEARDPFRWLGEQTRTLAIDDPNAFRPAAECPHDHPH